jgi:SAM-dependent methyltransferase
MIMQTFDTRSAKALRKTLFTPEYPLDDDILALGKGVETHQFLMHPAGQRPYIYLSKLVKEVSERHFGLDIGNLKVLDWGCGKGHVTHLLKKNGAQVTSCDVKSDANDSSFNQQTPIIDKMGFEIVPLTHEFKLPFKDACFDVVVGFGVLEHVPNDRESLKELSRILRPGGLYFCFFLPYTFSWTQKLSHMRGDFYHDHLYSWHLVYEMLSESKFSILDCWHRALFPKNSNKSPKHIFFEKLDQFLCTTPLKYFATNIEFVAVNHGKG